jgi:hypothetical protein
MYRRPASPARIRTASIASGPYATDDNASAESTGSATSLRMRSCTIAVLLSGAPMIARRRAWATRPRVEGGTSAAVVASIGGSSPARVLTGTTRKKRVGRISAGSG